MSIIIGLAFLTTGLVASGTAFWLVCARTTRHRARVVVSHDMSCGIFLLLGLSTLVNAATVWLLVVYYLGRMI